VCSLFFRMGCTTSSSSNNSSSSLFSSIPSLPSLHSFRYTSSPSLSILGGDPTDGSLENIPIYDFHDFTQLHFLSSGCIGSVYSAYHTVLGKVALKFFGYTKQFPDIVNIEHELAFLSSLREIDGVVQLKGYFIDTHEGYLPQKKTLNEFPVLVMEYLEGGELTKSMLQQQQRTERYLAQIFRYLILSLQGIHQKRFLHRDLKLENLMFASINKEPIVKIIDLGSMVSLPVLPSTTSKSKDKTSSNTLDIYRSFSLVGSPGMIAPETIMNYEYSSATDIWQAGCILYSLLSGQHAFSPNRVDKIVNATYFPLTSTQWNLISEDAKNLISLILVKNPEDRLTLSQILAHPWMANAHQASEKDLGEDYSTRIKSLALSRRIRDVFVKQDNLLLTRREKLENIQRLMPSMALKEFHQTQTQSHPQQQLQQQQALVEEYDQDDGNEEEAVASYDSASHDSPRSQISIQQNIEERVFLLKKNIISYLQSNLSSPRGRSNSLDGFGLGNGITPVIYEEENCLSETTTTPPKLLSAPADQSFSSTTVAPPAAAGSDHDSLTNSSKIRNGSLSSEDESALVSSLSGLTQPSQQSLMTEEISAPPPPPVSSLIGISNERSNASKSPFFLSTVTATTPTTATGTAQRKYPLKARHIDYSTYRQILCESGLETFSTKEIFDIFDSSSPIIPSSASASFHRLKFIDIMDVLFTFLVMYEDLSDYYSSSAPESLSPRDSDQHHQQQHQHQQQEVNSFDNSQLYFDMFDLNHTGLIDAKNLKIILRCLLLEEKYLSHYNTVLRHSHTPPPLPHHQSPLSHKHSFKKKPSHLRHRSSSSEISPVYMLGQHSGKCQSFETIRSMRSCDFDDLIQILDEEKNGFITYEQFKEFYDTLYLQLDSLPPSMI
jgi:serine/threonine protein kinase